LIFSIKRVPRYVLQHVEDSKKDIIGKEKRKLDDKERKEVENIAYERVEIAILEINIIKCFKEDEIKLSNRIIHRWPDDTYRNYYHYVQERLEEKALDDCLQRIRNMRDSYLASARGFLFECYVIHLFRTGKNLESEGSDQFSICSKPKVGLVKNVNDLLKYSERKYSYRSRQAKFRRSRLICNA